MDPICEPLTVVDNREEFLKVVKHAVIQDASPYAAVPSTRALVFGQEFGLIPKKHLCSDCDAAYVLSYRSTLGGYWFWRGPRYNLSCSTCCGTEIRVGQHSLLRGTKTKNWLTKLDSLVMFCKEYGRLTMLRELKGQDFKTVQSWCHDFQVALQSYVATRCKTLSQQRPHLRKRAIEPASVMKTSARFSRQVRKNHLKKTMVIMGDESYLNHGKRSKLTRNSRPKRDQIWLWGATVQGGGRRSFVFRVLKHPSDCLDGRPRGAKEMLENLRSLNMSRNDVYVSDKWGCTVAAVRQLMKENGWRRFNHQIVNHSAGEITNTAGYSTNAIEAKWSILKRWVKKLHSGKLPRDHDREKWSLLLDEFHYRQVRSEQSPNDSGNTWEVPLTTMMKDLSEYRY